MKFRVTLWLASLFFFLLSLFLLGPMLPERVATHFGASGPPDGWMTHGGYLLFTAIFGLIFPSFLVGLCYVMHFLPAKLFNVPHPEYWRTLEHYPDACGFLFRESFWLGALSFLWITALNVLTVEANRHVPARMDTGLVILATAVSLGGALFWIGRVYWHYARGGEKNPQEHL